MDITVIANPRAAHQLTHQALLARGLSAHGHRVILQENNRELIETQHVACWAWHIGQRLYAQGHDVLVMERGYVGDRFLWTSLAWNGLNNRGWVPPAPADGGARFSQHFAQLMKPYNPHGDYVLIVGQVPGDASLQGRNLQPWYERVAKEAARTFGVPARFRPHPEALRRGRRQVVAAAPSLDGTLASALHGARAVITYNSNTGVDAMLAGKPVSAEDSGSMIWQVCDRDRWAQQIAWRQWLPHEIEDGTAIAHLGVPPSSAARVAA